MGAAFQLGLQRIQPLRIIAGAAAEKLANLGVGHVEAGADLSTARLHRHRCACAGNQQQAAIGLDQLPAQAYGRLLLLPGAKAPVAVKSRGRQICTCLNVTEPDILGALPSCHGTADQQFTQLQETLKCGTNCGSCIPEVKRIVLRQLTPA